MPRLNAKCRDMVVQALSDGLPNVMVQSNRFIQYHTFSIWVSAAERSLPGSGKIRDEFRKFISEEPLSNFCYDYIDDFLGDSVTYDGKQPDRPLSELIEDGEAFLSRMMDGFEGLPWNYSIGFPLSQSVSDMLNTYIGPIRVSDAIRIEVSDEQLLQTFPPTPVSPSRPAISETKNALAALFREDVGTFWKSNTAYVLVRETGYIDSVGSTEPFYRAHRYLKSLLGLLIAHNVIATGTGLISRRGTESAIVHREGDGEWLFDRYLFLDGSRQVGLSNLVENTVIRSIVDPGKRREFVSHCFADVSVAFSTSPQAQRLRTSAQWLYDSFVNRDNLLSFLQAMVSAEILLGEESPSGEASIGELIRNRCAFLIADSSTERDKIRNDMREIYRIRSKIVHAGKDRLSASEFDLLDKLRWYVRRVIFREIELLAKG